MFGSPLIIGKVSASPPKFHQFSPFQNRCFELQFGASSGFMGATCFIHQPAPQEVGRVDEESDSQNNAHTKVISFWSPYSQVSWWIGRVNWTSTGGFLLRLADMYHKCI